MFELSSSSVTETIGQSTHYYWLIDFEKIQYTRDEIGPIFLHKPTQTY